MKIISDKLLSCLPRRTTKTTFLICCCKTVLTSVKTTCGETIFLFICHSIKILKAAKTKFRLSNFTSNNTILMCLIYNNSEKIWFYSLWKAHSIMNIKSCSTTFKIKLATVKSSKTTFQRCSKSCSTSNLL